MEFNYAAFCARHPYRIVGEGLPERRFAGLLCAARSVFQPGQNQAMCHVEGPGGGITTFRECAKLVIDWDAQG